MVNRPVAFELVWKSKEGEIVEGVVVYVPEASPAVAYLVKGKV